MQLNYGPRGAMFYWSCAYASLRKIQPTTLTHFRTHTLTNTNLPSVFLAWMDANCFLCFHTHTHSCNLCSRIDRKMLKRLMGSHLMKCKSLPGLALNWAIIFTYKNPPCLTPLHTHTHTHTVGQAGREREGTFNGVTPFMDRKMSIRWRWREYHHH